MKLLPGSKTYIVSGLGALVTFCYMMGWIERTTWEGLLALLGFGVSTTLRMAVKKVEDKV